MEDLEEENLEYEIVGEFLMNLKKEFGGDNNETMKVAELKKIKQENRTMEEFVQKFRGVVRGSSYERKLLIEEFRREMNRTIQQRLMESEC